MQTKSFENKTQNRSTTTTTKKNNDTTKIVKIKYLRQVFVVFVQKKIEQVNVENKAMKVFYFPR